MVKFTIWTSVRATNAKHTLRNAGVVASRAGSGDRYSTDCSLCQVCVPLQLDLAGVPPIWCHAECHRPCCSHCPAAGGMGHILLCLHLCVVLVTFVMTSADRCIELQALTHCSCCAFCALFVQPLLWLSLAALCGDKHATGCDCCRSKQLPKAVLLCNLILPNHYKS